MTDLHNKAFSTRAVHAGERTTQGNSRPVTSSIVPSVSYTYESMDDLDAVFGNTQPGFIYSRYTSPTVATFETAVANLEEGEAALAFSSGMAAVQAALLAAGVQAGTRRGFFLRRVWRNLQPVDALLCRHGHEHKNGGCE